FRGHGGSVFTGCRGSRSEDQSHRVFRRLSSPSHGKINGRIAGTRVDGWPVNRFSVPVTSEKPTGGVPSEGHGRDSSRRTVITQPTVAWRVAYNTVFTEA